jgi:excisionase family DNA binding protein
VGDRLLSIRDVANYLGVSERTVFRMMHANEISGVKVGNRWRFNPDVVKEYLQRQRQSQGSSPA